MGRKPPWTASRGALAFWLGLICCGLLSPAVFAIWQWPGPDTDAIAFLPAALHFRNGEGLINPIWSGTDVTDPSGSKRFTLHGPAFPLVVASLMPSGRVKDFVWPLTLFRLASVVILATALTALASRGAKTVGGMRPVGGFALAALAMLADGAMRTGLYGRPETLATPLLALGMAVLVFRIGGSWTKLIAFALFGCCAAVSPGVGFLVVLVALTALTTTRPFGGANFGGKLAALLCPGAVAVGVFLVCIALSPHGVVESLAGIGRAGERDAGRFSIGVRPFVRYWLFWWDRPFFGPPMILAAATAAAAMWKRVGTSARGWLAAGQLACLAGCWLFGLKLAGVTYNFAAFTPVGFVWLAAWAWQGSARRQVMAAALLLPCNLVHFKTGIEIHHMLRAGTTFDAAREALGKVIRPEDRLLVTFPTWVLPDERLPKTEWTDGSSPVPGPVGKGGRVLWIRELMPGESVEETEARAKQWHPIFRFGPAERPQVFGVPVTKFGPGYSFEVLERVMPFEGGPNR